jgi:hypothetical protein
MKILIAIFLLLAGHDALAQWSQNNRQNRAGRGSWYQGRQTTLGGGLEIGIPMGQFSESWGREIVGVSANLGVPMRLLPFDWGFDFSYGRMGGDRQVVALNEQFLSTTTGELKVNSVIYGYHGLLRFKPINGKVSPYVEGLLGLRHFTTKSRVEVDGLDQPLRKERNANDFTGSSGWAVGVQVAPTRAFYVEGRVERLNSGRVSFVDPNTIVIDGNGGVEFETRSSQTRVVNVHLGVGLRF